MGAAHEGHTKVTRTPCEGHEKVTTSSFERKQFTFYVSYLDALEDLPEKDQSKTLLAIIRYALRGIEPKGLSMAGKVAFSLVKPTLDSGMKKARARMKQPLTTDHWEEDNGTSSDHWEEDINHLQSSGRKEKEGEKEREVEKESEREKDNSNPLVSLWLDYPAHRREDFELLRQAVADAKIQDFDLDKIRSNLQVWKKTIDWQEENGRFVPGITKWIRSGQCLSRPAAAQLTSNPFLAMQMEMEGRL